MRLVLTALLTLAVSARAAPPAGSPARPPAASTAGRTTGTTAAQAAPAGATPKGVASKAQAGVAKETARAPAAKAKKKARTKAAHAAPPEQEAAPEASASTAAAPVTFEAPWATSPSSAEASAQLRAVSPAADAPVAQAGPASEEPLAAEVVSALDTVARLQVSFAAGVSELGAASFTRGAAAVKRGELEPGRGRLIAARASRLVGTRNIRRVYRRLPDDCSGLVRAAYEGAGIDLVSHGFERGENAVSAIYRRAEERGAIHRRRPRPGDLVFFRETYDRNRDGKRNDGLTHIAVVEKVDRDGTVTFVHRGSRGVSRSLMNLRSPRVHRAEDGRVINDYIRAASKRSRAWLSGELFIAYASPDVL